MTPAQCGKKQNAACPSTLQLLDRRGSKFQDKIPRRGLVRRRLGVLVPGITAKNFLIATNLGQNVWHVLSTLALQSKIGESHLNCGACSWSWLVAGLPGGVTVHCLVLFVTTLFFP